MAFDLRVSQGKRPFTNYTTQGAIINVSKGTGQLSLLMDQINCGENEKDNNNSFPE